MPSNNNSSRTSPQHHLYEAGRALSPISPFKMNGSAPTTRHGSARFVAFSPNASTTNVTLSPNASHKPLLEVSRISNGFSPGVGDRSKSNGILARSQTAMASVLNSSNGGENVDGVHEMLASLALMCLLSLLMAFLALFFLQRTGPIISLPEDNAPIDSNQNKINRNNLNQAISQTRIILNAKEYVRVFQISVSLSTLTISLNLCCLFVCCIQFLSSVKLLKTHQGKKR